MGVSRGLPRIDGVALYVELQRKSNMSSTRVKESVRKGLVYVCNDEELGKMVVIEEGGGVVESLLVVVTGGEVELSDDCMRLLSWGFRLM